MSASAKNVMCPDCGAEQRIEVVDSVSIQRDPEIRDRVLAGTFMRFACAHCASSYLVEADILYTDMDRRLFVGVFPRERRSDVTACEALIGQTYDEVYVGETPAFAQSEFGELERRVVFGYEQLREKVVCFDAGLDDHIIEAVKVALNDVHPELGALVSLQLVDDKYLWFARIGIDAPPFAVERSIYQTMADDRQQVQTLLRPLWSGSYVSAELCLTA